LPAVVGAVGGNQYLFLAQGSPESFCDWLDGRHGLKKIHVVNVEGHAMRRD